MAFLNSILMLNCDSDLFQAVRIVDVFVLGPAMVNLGNRVGGPVGCFVAFAGVATIVFNGITFFDIEKRKTQ